MLQNIPFALTFDDVLLEPCYSEILPTEVQTGAELAPGISLHVPIVSAAMDTVTESGLAMAMAREGGLGFVHKNLTIEQQAKEVLRVKKSESGMVLDPITIGPEQTLAEARALMNHHNISGILVVKKDQLVGIITNRDLRFEERGSIEVKEAMTANVVTAPEGITAEDSRMCC